MNHENKHDNPERITPVQGAIGMVFMLFVMLWILREPIQEWAVVFLF